MSNWMVDQLNAAERERVFTVMRRMRGESDRLYDEAARLSAPYGQVAVGGAHLTPLSRAEGLSTYLRALNAGGDPASALEAANSAKDLVLKRWNARREYQVQRAVGDTDAKVMLWHRRVLGAVPLRQKEKT